ncbi:hypothetical protein GLOTRDRAFT_70571 [Gloeophyllum trabeum ATCC 11539]|uniref:Uncharacterized protein n=1 Tax=Gloeophyllum trabeum (strain ATCC 11539 / FP-39264 / Madison 617) TaxID=670483 RepID=S7QIW1_GLOTA|nr:uncharacterized protein GLOTRDRAFT_70571 [Gloeophyllum trabeum ATCC 11539]EPQ59278.1 hypothetical protein GLOTRDRAFT_70571 [Gloeophyllum trabeum ATCC 11539]
MPINHAPILARLAQRLDQPPDSEPTPRPKLESDPCLPARLPNNAFIQREAEREAPYAYIRQLRRSPTPPESEADDAPEKAETTQQRSSSSAATSPPSSPTKRFSFPKASSQPKGPWKDPEPYEVYRAIEKKDLVFLMEVRDRAFHLLLRKHGNATPLVHAMRIGRSHQDVAIILLGAFSRWINHLSDEDFSKPATKTLLKALRTNLKLAIDYGLQASYTDLIASFLQTLVMSEGDRWIYSQVSSMATALRAGISEKPVTTAEFAVRNFATRELGKADAIAALEDYVANATVDLLMMGIWSIVLDQVEGEPIPVYYFARDDRVYKAFCQRIDDHKAAIQRTASRRLRWQIRVLRAVLETRATTYRRKVEVLKAEFDEGPGV